MLRFRGRLRAKAGQNHGVQAVMVVSARGGSSHLAAPVIPAHDDVRKTDRRHDGAKAGDEMIDSEDTPGARNRGLLALVSPQPSAQVPQQVVFDRHELGELLSLYGRMVAAGEWRDYAMDFTKDRAVFSVFRRSHEFPLYRIEKNPKLARRQGAYAVTGSAGQVLKRGHDLHRVLAVLERPLRLVVG
jgi:hypothetical protein